MLKTKKVNKLKKIFAVIFILLTVFSTAQPIFAVSSSGTGKWVAGEWDSNIYTTDDSGSVGILIRRLVNYITGERLTVFCAEHGVSSHTGEIETATHIKPSDPKMKEASKIAYLGWYSKYGSYVVDGGIMSGSMVDRKLDYVFTQQMVWEALGQSNATFRDSSIQNKYVEFKKDINSQMKRLSTKPSFSDTTVTVEVGETITLTDSNKVLSDYASIDTTTNEIRFVHKKGENTMTITVGENCTIEDLRITDEMMKNWGLIKEETADKDTTVYFQFDEGVQKQLYAMNYNDPVALSLNLSISFLGKLELSKLNTNGDLIDGAIFNITNENGYNKDIKVTNGKIVIDQLKKGTYFIKEKSSPDGYLLNTETYKVVINPNQTTTQAVVNDEPVGNITIIKTNTNGDKIQGVKFRIIAKEDIFNKAKTVKYYSKGDTVATIITNSAGTASKNGLPLGKYLIEEIEVATGYLINTEQKTVTLKYKDQNTNIIYESVTFENEEPTGSLSIEKIDADTGNKDRFDGTSHHGDVSIKGAVYTLYATSDIYNKAGAVKYFSKDEEVATFTFNEYGVATIKITNNDTPAEIGIEGTKLVGLPMGSFYAKETVVPNGYTQDTNIYTYNFEYKDNATKVIEINGTVKNTVQKAPFEVIKVSTNDNTTAETVAGAEFTAILTKYVEYYGSFEEALKHIDEFAEDEYSVFKTGDDGHGVSGLLAYGEYTVNETYTPSDEIEAVEEFYVTIDKDSKTPIKEFVENDLPFEAYIKIQKQDKDTGKLVTYSNATFELYKLNEETNEWEQVKCKVGDNYFTSWSTNNEGVARTETKLESGLYKVEEIKIPTGFVELDEELTFEVNNRNSTLEYDDDWDAWITVTVKNEQPTGTLKVNKEVTLRDDVDTSLLKDKEIDFTQISFELVAKENIVDYTDGSIIYEAGTVIGKYNLSKEGTLEVTDLKMGKYYLKELTTIEGAVLDETEHEVIFEQTDTTTKEYLVELDIENVTPLIEISKQDITGEKELEGAKLTVLDENGNVIDTWVSTEKPHTIEGLVVGKTYTLREEIAPTPYTKATDIKFTIENTGEVQKVVMIDKIVEVVKTDLVTGEEIEGAELKVIDKDGNVIDEWISTKEPHIVKGLEENEVYKLVEITAPYGFEVAEEVEFTVTEDKETQRIEMKDMPIMKDIQVVKIDSDTKEIIKESFKFGFYEDEACTKLIKEVEGDKKTGLALFEDLRYGTFFIKESEAPKGYMLSDKVVKIVVNEEGVFADDVALEEKDGIYSFEYENKKIETPKTGDNRNIVLAVIVIIISLSGITVLTIKKIKNRKNK